MDSIDQANAVRRHLNRLRRLPCFKSTTLMAAVEGNYGAPTAVTISRAFREYRPYSIFADNGPGSLRSNKAKRAKHSLRDGGRGTGHGADARLYVNTHKEDKDRHVVIVRDVLRRHGGLGILEDMAVTNESLTQELGTLGVNQPMPSGIGRTRPMVKKLCNQLKQYRRVTRLAKSGQEEWQEDKSKWSGKGGGQNDDLAMAFFIAMAHAMLITNSTAYDLQGMLTS